MNRERAWTLVADRLGYLLTSCVASPNPNFLIYKMEMNSMNDIHRLLLILFTSLSPPLH